jgi:metallophosphoesterase superfamily enzyme
MQELREIPKFFSHFISRVRVDVVPGNHDGGLKGYLPKGVKLHKSSGVRIGKFFLTHGHAWPGKDFLKTNFVITAHNHPQIEFRSKLGYRWSEPVWLRADLRPEPIAKKYGLDDGSAKSLPEVIVVPCFNEFAGGVALNRKVENRKYGNESKSFLGPIVKSINEQGARVYMLDSVFLGELGKL